MQRSERTPVAPQPSTPSQQARRAPEPQGPQESAGNHAPGAATGVTAPVYATVLLIIACMVTAFCALGFSAGVVAHSGTNLLVSLITLIVLLGGTASPLVLRTRDRNPERVCIIASVVTALLPCGPVFATAALSCLIARRIPSRRIQWIEGAAIASLVITGIRDAILPASGSFVKYLLSSPSNASTTTGDFATDVNATVSATTGASASTPNMAVVLVTELIITALWVLLAYLVGNDERHRALERASQRETQAQRSKTEHLQTALNGQQFADAVAAEAHDTLAHSLSLIALNANVLKMQTDTLQHMLTGTPREAVSQPYADAPATGLATRAVDTSAMDTKATNAMEPDAAASDATVTDAASSDPAELARSIGIAAENIRRQAAGALDEVHGIISILRDPQAHTDLLAPGADTSLTYESLNSLVDDARSSGMPLDSWIDVRDLNAVSPAVGKLAYRVVQEGLTNAQRHAPGERVSLAVSCNRQQGIAIHFSNPMPAHSMQQSASQETMALAPTTPLPADGNIIVTNNTASSGNATGGNGLPGLKQRVDEVGGSITWGVDWRNTFHLDATLPLSPIDQA